MKFWTSVLGLAIATTAIPVMAQDWKEWVKQNPTYPSGVPQKTTPTAPGSTTNEQPNTQTAPVTNAGDLEVSIIPHNSIPTHHRSISPLQPVTCEQFQVKMDAYREDAKEELENFRKEGQDLWQSYLRPQGQTNTELQMASAKSHREELMVMEEAAKTHFDRDKKVYAKYCR